ncbi:MAG: TraR/DksA family transcriptional regulator [Bdellovibrionales bacterium]|nr:TraR/DksA family transcriptional regulator [Bdellovibrionales bacterium]
MKTKHSSTLTRSAVRQKAPAKVVSRGELGLTKKQLKELHERLLELRAEFLSKINGKASTFQVGLEAESLIKGDDAEVAEKQRASNAALQELDFLKSRLALVQRAISKIEHGCYGVCEETEEEIGYERLSVVPWARYSVHVQELRERRQREFKVSRLRSET